MSSHWRPAYIGIGSNLDSPTEQVRMGIAAIANYPDTRLVLSSPLYCSSPMGPQDQPEFINAVVAVLTLLSPEGLFRAMQETESEHGRDRSSGHWGPRTLDLDLLSLSSVNSQESTLTLPHPGVRERNFVLLPWSDIAPHYNVPGLTSVSALAAAAPSEPAIQKEG